MKGSKHYQAKFSGLSLILSAVIFFLSAATAEAENYTIGIVGIESRIKDTNLGDYTNLDSPDFVKTPLDFAQNIFESVLTEELPLIGLQGVDKSSYAREMRENEVKFQKTQVQMQKAITSLERGDTSEAVKLFDKKLDYYIYGYINNMTNTHRESFLTSNVAVEVDLSVRIVDASTGKIVCIATGKGKSSSHGEAYRKSFKNGDDEISEEHWRKALEKALNQIVEKIKKQV